MPETVKLVKHVSIYAVSGIASRLVGFLMLPIYTRYLSPADYGVVALITIVISVLEGTLGVRMMQAVSKFYYEQNNTTYRKTVISTAIIVTSMAGVLAVLVMFFSRSEISQLLFDTSEFGIIVGLFSFSLVTQGFGAYGFLYIRLQQLPVKFLQVSLSKLALQLSLNVYFVVYLEKGLMGIALAQFLSLTILAAYFAGYIFLKTGIRFSFDFAKKLVIFSWPLWIAGLASLYVGSVDKFFIQHFDSLASVGLLGLAQQFAAILTALVWGPFMQYWGAERYIIYQAGTNQQQFDRTFTAAVSIMLIGAAGISMYSPIIIAVMADPEFHSAYRAIPLLCLAAVFQSFSQFSNLGIMVSSNTKLIARTDIINALLTTVLLFMLVPQYGFVGAAAAYAVTSVIRFLAIHFMAAKLFDMKLNIPAFIIVTVVVGFFVGVFSVRGASPNLGQQVLDASLSFSIVLFVIATYAIITARLWKLLPAGGAR